jgi:hypothetical protein
MQVPSFLRRLAAASLAGRRLRVRVFAPLMLAPAFALVPASAALASSGLQCANSNQYGSSCIDITGSGLQVQDVQGYFTPPNNDYLSHRRWALELTSYPCNPIHKLKSQCSPRHRWFTAIRHGNPPQAGSSCVILTPNGVGYQQCVNYGLAYADANFGDFRGFYRMPHEYGGTTWLCSELAVRVHGHWRSNGAARSVGVRGCAEVHD